MAARCPGDRLLQLDVECLLVEEGDDRPMLVQRAVAGEDLHLVVGASQVLVGEPVEPDERLHLQVRLTVGTSLDALRMGSFPTWSRFPSILRNVPIRNEPVTGRGP